MKSTIKVRNLVLARYLANMSLVINKQILLNQSSYPRGALLYRLKDIRVLVSFQAQ